LRSQLKGILGRSRKTNMRMKKPKNKKQFKNRTKRTMNFKMRTDNDLNKNYI
jgi:hypothetical protein